MPPPARAAAAAAAAAATAAATPPVSLCTRLLLPFTRIRSLPALPLLPMVPFLPLLPPRTVWPFLAVDAPKAEGRSMAAALISKPTSEGMRVSGRAGTQGWSTVCHAD